MTTKPYTEQIYYALTLDPVHIGTGGYRLGRVDNSIMREPGTNLPKIPGTSISGVCRANAAMATGRYDYPVKKKDKDDKEFEIRGSCAGQGQADSKKQKAGHCGERHCPVCVTFGFARGDSGGFQGLAQFSDARILFFPVHSMIGPVWVTCPSVLAEHGSTESVANENSVRLSEGMTVANNRLNLGWLMLPCDGTPLTLPDTLPENIPAEVKKRAVLVSDKLFSRIVNDNLEVRTSVSIDPATGAAETGALYTYEAIPRAAVLWFSVTYSKPEFFRIGGEKIDPREGANEGGIKTKVEDVVEKGFALFEHLGIGGMNTRGMGRVRILNLNGAGGQQQ